jgi:type IV secretion system protein VirD4
MMFHWERKQKDRGLYLGRLVRGKGLSREVFYPNPIHAITLGPNGSGKTTLIVSNLAKLRRSTFLVDPKGETLAITWRARAKLGPVVVLCPFALAAVAGKAPVSHGYNPMADLDPTSDNFTDDASLIGLALVPERGGDSTFFDKSAQALVTALVMHDKIMNGPKANLGNVRRLLTQPFTAAGLQKTIADMAESHCEPLRSKAGRFVSGSRSSMDVIATAISSTDFLDSPPIQRDLQGPGFDWDLMKREIVTVYLVLPADRLESHANYLRLIVTSALRSLLRSPPSDTLPPVAMILDEFAQLGFLPPIQNAAGIARGFGVQLWMILQDLSQLHALYHDRWQSLVGNAGLLSAFAPRDLFSAKYLSDLCGKQGRNVRSQSTEQGGKVSYNDSPHDFDFLKPEELMKMGPGNMLNLVAGLNPFFTRPTPYWELPEAGDLDANPYFKART